MSFTIEALCCNCLRVHQVVVDRFEAIHSVPCTCGALELCACTDCERTVSRLRNGERGTLGGLLRQPLYSWSESDGAFLETNLAAVVTCQEHAAVLYAAAQHWRDAAADGEVMGYVFSRSMQKAAAEVSAICRSYLKIDAEGE